MNSIVGKLPPYMTEQCKVVLFDGKCKLCNFWVRFIIRNDTKKVFKLATVQSPEGQKLLKHFEMSTEHFDTMLYIDGYQSFTKSDAAIQIARQLNRPWNLWVILNIIPAGIRDYFYDRIALNRYRLFGQYDHCLIPSADHEDRFIITGSGQKKRPVRNWP